MANLSNNTALPTPSAMTASAAVTEALQLLGYRSDEVSSATSLAAVNQVGEELWRVEMATEWTPLSALTAAPGLSAAGMETLICGVASLLALSVGDIDLREEYAAKYAEKRRALYRPAGRRLDVMPGGGCYGC